MTDTDRAQIAALKELLRIAETAKPESIRGSTALFRVRVAYAAVLATMLSACLTTSTSGDPPGGVTDVGTIHECTLRYECSKAIETVRVCVPFNGETEIIDLCPPPIAAPKPSCACSFVCEETLKPCTIGGD